jgi:polar amino acid transport system substrate-binding protein
MRQMLFGWLFGVAMVIHGVDSAAAEVIQLSTTEYPPYMSQSAPGGGLLVTIATEAFKRSGYELRVNYLPWARALETAKLGDTMQGVAGYWVSKEREPFFYASEPLLNNHLGFFRRTDRVIAFKHMAELNPYVIGTVREYANPKVFDDAHLKTDEAVDDATNLAKLAAGRVDLVLVERGVANSLLDGRLSSLKGKVVWMEPALEVTPMRISISRQAPRALEKLEAFNRGLRSMRRDGTLARMLSKADI